jgi:hydroxymethylpyrimidine/phosphomethylpyrimidine kinase
MSTSYLAAKHTDFIAIEDSAKVVIDVIEEIKTHRSFCQHFGVTIAELENTPESSATTAYGAYILDMGLQGRIHT